MSDTAKPLNLRRKLVAVMGALGYIPKHGRNAFHGYNYATESDVADAVRTALVTHGVFALTSLEAVEARDITTAKGNRDTVTTATIAVTFLDTDSDESLTIRMAGSGQDPGDKGVMKAITAAVKYALLKTFILPTGDDPEADASVDEQHAPATAPPKAPAKATPPPSPPDTGPGATTGQATSPPVETPAAPDVATLTALIAEVGAATSAILKHYSVESLDDLTADQRRKLATQLAKKRAA